MPENQNLNNEQQETTPSGNKIYILSRNNYDNWQGSYGNNIFFVRENSADQDKMVSVYVGESKQSNIVVTNESDIWDRTTNNYTIPEKYQVSDKIFLIKRTLVTGTEQETPDNTIYGIVTWNGERFIDCGIPNNVIVLTDIEEGISDLSQWLSQNITGIKDFIYIIPNYHSIYYYDGANGYISIISVDSFVTVEMLNEVASRIPVADELTVLSKVSNSQTVFSAAGADLSGKMVIVGSDNPVEARTGATIFNNYNPTPVSGKQGYKYGTTAIGAYSSAFGTGNVTRGSNSVAFGSSNTIENSGSNSIVCGSHNTINGSGCIVNGNSNSTLSGAGAALVNGNSNTVSSSAGGGNFASGFRNNVGSGGTTAIGSMNTVSSVSFATAIGSNNTISCSSYPSGRTYGINSIALGSFNTIDCYSYDISKNDIGGIAIGYKNTLQNSAVGSISIGGYYNGSDSYNTVSSPRSIVIGSNNRLNPSLDSGGDNFVIGKGNTVYQSVYSSSNYAKEIHIFGDANSIGSSGMTNGLSGSAYVMGQGNIVGTNGLGEDNTYVIGWDNKVGITGYNFGGNSILVGRGLITQVSDQAASSYSPMLYMGKFNTGNRHDIVIANGVSDGDTFDAISIDGSIIKVNPDRYVRSGSSFQGDLVSGHGTSLTLRTDTIQPSSQSITGKYQVNYLPVNNSITSVIWDNANKLEFMLNSDNKFEFNILANNVGEIITLDLTTDYSCLLVIPKLSSFNSASDIIVNFTANDASKIYLLNQDIDISSYTILHVLLFYDLSNLCAIVSGYQEVTTP